MRLVIIGCNGQVGYELQRSLAPLGKVTALARARLDMSQPDTLAGKLAEVRPDVVVNASAYTAVDKAETDVATAETVNRDAVAALAVAAAAQDFQLVHYSTDYVFDGDGTQPYLETDRTNPQGVYGRSKREGEVAIEDSGCRHVILRTSWVHGSHGANFARTILRLARERSTLNVVADQIGAPTSAALIADVTAHIIRQTGAQDAGGVFHLASAGETSWYDYARFVVETAARRVALQLTPDAISPIASSQYPQPAKRPANSRLDTTKLRQTFGLALPDWHGGVERTVLEITKEAT
jgi:dTDP-4-dehydrorhamnose reductase